MNATDGKEEIIEDFRRRSKIMSSVSDVSLVGGCVVSKDF